MVRVPFPEGLDTWMYLAAANSRYFNRLRDFSAPHPYGA